MRKIEIDKKFYGNFVEHMGRALYGGIYDVKKNCFNEKVTSLLKEVNTSIIRYPGGNFVSGYDWLDGIGPRDSRPIRLELAWDSIEPNIVGTDEFLNWTEKNDFEPMMCVNLGTGSEMSAARLVEYCNSEDDTTITRMRRDNGRELSYNVKYWCLGNEMDGPWQIMHCSAEDYAKKAREAAKLMKLVDPNIKLIACGSSQCELPTYPEWDRVVLQELFPYVDYISAHRYYDNNLIKDFNDFLYSYVDLEEYIKTIKAVIQYCKSYHRSSKEIFISFDEWNVVNSATWDERKREFAPHESESKNSFLDALVLGDMLITMLKNSDIIKIACQSMLINVGAPIMIREDGEIYYQSLYYPLYDVFNTMPEYVVDIDVESECVNHNKFGLVNVLNSVVTCVEGKYIMYVVNHSELPQNISDVYIDSKLHTVCNVKSFVSDDLYATNTKNKIEITKNNIKITYENTVPAYSWNMIELEEK